MGGAADLRASATSIAPAVELSVVIPCFNNASTVAGCLEALRAQTLRGFEVVMVDSSPDDECEAIVRRFPEVRYEHVPTRLLPHAARNRAVEASRGRLLVFTDPDTYGRPDWLERMVASHRATGRITVGALACHGRRWIDRGIHLCKFSTWLPGGPPREVDNAPTANLLCPRELFESLGRFDGELVHGDTTFSWKAREHGHPLWFAPEAVVAHHHVQGTCERFHERHSRGILYGELRADRWENRRPTLLAYLAASLLPVRLSRVLLLTAGRCRRAHCLADLAATLPIVALGHAAALLGESRAYARRLLPRPGAASG